MVRSLQVRNVCWTWNNPQILPGELLDSWTEISKYCVFQLEMSQSGTPHYQGYTEFPKKYSFATLIKRYPGIHLEKRRGSAKQASDYCQKQDTRTDGPWTSGEIVHPGIANDLYSVGKAIREGADLEHIAMDCPELFIKHHKGIERLIDLNRPSTLQGEKSIHVIHGPAGIGKTKWVIDNEPDLYVKTSGNKWFDGYTDQPAILLDEFEGYLPLNLLLQIIDPIQAPRVEYKGGTRTLLAVRIYITCNTHPRQWYDFAGRTEKMAALQRRVEPGFSTIDAEYCKIKSVY